MYEVIISEIEPRGTIMQTMLEKRLMDEKFHNELSKTRQRSDRAKKLVDLILNNPRSDSCLEFMEVMKLDYEWICEEILKLNEGNFPFRAAKLSNVDVYTNLLDMIENDFAGVNVCLMPNGCETKWHN